MAQARAAVNKPLYNVHPGVTMVQKWIAQLKGKAGRSLDEWITLAKKEGPKEDKARREWLKTKHKLGPNKTAVVYWPPPAKKSTKKKGVSRPPR
jgi:hypothetical protein